MTDILNYKESMGTRVPKTFIDPSATWGEGSVIWHFSVILQEVRIGNHCSIGSRCEIGRGSVIGDDSRIGSGVFLPPNSQIGERVFIGPNVTFTDDMHPRVHLEGEAPYHPQPPIVEDDAAIGAHCVILPGVRIGKGARVAAGTIVATDIPDCAMMRMPSAGKFRTQPREWEHRAALRVAKEATG